MNANDIIEKCAEICDRYALKNHEAAVKAGRRASRLLEIDSAQRETAEIGSVECEAAALEAVAIADAIRALKSSLPAESTEFAWLIEAPGAKYLATRRLGVDQFFWTSDHHIALRFINEQQSNGVMMAVRVATPCLFDFERTLGDAKAIEHGWISTSIPKGGDANEPETLPGLDKSSPGVTAGASPAEKDGGMTEEQIKRLVDRFLQWRLPKNFNPDAGISYKRPNYAPNIDATPSGTNLLDAAQATDMVRFMVEGMPASSLPAETVSEAMVEAARDAFDAAYAAEYIGGALGCRDNKDIALLAALEAALAHADDGWRPIEDGVPEDRETVLLFVAQTYRKFCVVGYHLAGCFFLNSDGCAVEKHVTHWRPLPAPPKDGRE